MVRVQKFFPRKGRTKQSFKNECDINLIMKRFRNVMGVDFLNRYQGYLNGLYGDFSNVGDYRSALEQVKRAEAGFEALPLNVRERFGNDPARFLDFCGDPKNLDEMQKLGLLPKGASDQVEPKQTVLKEPGTPIT